jgi:cytochrome c oxidase subunit 2
VALVALVSTGCSAERMQRGFLPGDSDNEITDHTGIISNLWNGSWIAAWLTGFLTWGLLIWVMTVYRRRRGTTDLPTQIRYNLPIEMMYIAIPLFMVLTLFYFTERDQSVIEDFSEEADVQIEVLGKQWAWDFNYTTDEVWDSSVKVPYDRQGRPQEEIPTLYLPVDQQVELTIHSRDVAHSFWVIEFLYKKDMIPGRTNYYEFVPQVEGLYRGKCAELCGEYHSEMIFQVAVVSQEEYDQQMEDLRDRGQDGSLPLELGRSGQDGVEDGSGVSPGGNEEQEVSS